MSQPIVPQTIDRVKFIKQLLESKAALDYQIDQAVRQLTPEERQRLYRDNLYFPEKDF